MSTRANIKVQDATGELWFYRHSDGYPAVATQTLNKFMTLLNEGKIRDNLTQASGWLIRLGASEYDVPELPDELDTGYSWKVGSIEPTTGQHGDIEYLYTIDLPSKTLMVKEIK